MAEDQLCGRCKAWLCRGDDAWCGRCGASCARLELWAIPAALHRGDLPSRLFFRLTNATCTAIAVRGIDRPPWLSFPVEQAAKVPPGESAGFWAAADLEKIAQPTAADIVFSSSVGEVSMRVMVFDKNPAMVCTPETIETWAGPAGEVCRTEVEVAPRVGMLKMRGVRLLKLPGRILAENLQGGWDAAPGHGAKIAIEVSAARMPLGIQPATLEVTFDGPHEKETAQAPIRVQVRRPPQIRWAGDEDHPEVRHQTEKQSLALVFLNQHPDGRDSGTENGELEIQSITLSPPRGLQIPIQRLSDLPVRVRGGESHTAQFELNLKGLQGQPGGLIEFGFTVRTNLPTLRDKVALRVEPMARYEGVVAIDFGTSNTCCAVLPDGGEPELLALDEENKVTPTAVRYMDMLQSPPSVDTGTRAWSGAIREGDATSVADGLKRTLRQRRQDIDIRPVNPRKWMSRKASEAAADYLRSLRQLAEIRKAAIFERFILTHPARCPLRQHDRLRRALLEAFGASREPISFLSEPVAALVPYIAARARGRDLKEYTVASFDIGGGTTDLAIIHVSYRRPTSDQLDVIPQVLYCKGVDFGGEDLTDYFKSQFEASCEEMLRARDSGATIVKENMSGAAPLDVRRNRVELRMAAESFKFSLSGRSIPPGDISLRVKLANGRIQDFPFDFAAVCRQGGRDLKASFLEHTKSKVKEIAGMLKDAAVAKGVELDIIQLSGKTASIGVVRMGLKETFRNVTIETAEELKECVVKGACLSQSLRRGKMRLVLPNSMERMTSSIGVFPPRGAYFQRLLRADTEIPAEGLRADVPAFWTGSEHVILWEDVDGDDRQIDYATASRHLDNLGTWEPERRVDNAIEDPWTLRLTLKEFQLAVEALGPDGQVVRFQPIRRVGE